MTDCKELPGEQFLLDYLSGELPESETVRFEEHYFACSSCLARVEALQDVQLKLRAQPRQLYRAPIPWPVRFAVIGAIAAMVLAVAFAFHGRHQGQQPSIAAGGSTPEKPGSASMPSVQSPSIKTSAAQLADLALPPFQMPQLRGERSNPDFKSGMTGYINRNCPAAIRDLARVPAGDQDLTAARFYRGVCLMQEKDFAGAFTRLRSVAEAGDSPQQEAALYYLAQIALAENDIPTARHNLSLVISIRGDFENRARAQLVHLSQGDAGK